MNIFLLDTDNPNVKVGVKSTPGGGMVNVHQTTVTESETTVSENTETVTTITTVITIFGAEATF